MLGCPRLIQLGVTEQGITLSLLEPVHKKRCMHAGAFSQGVLDS